MHPQVALRAARTRPRMVRAMILVAPAVLNPLDNKFVMGRDPNANLFSPIVNLRTRVEMTAKLAAFNLQVSLVLEWLVGAGRLMNVDCLLFKRSRRRVSRTFV